MCCCCPRLLACGCVQTTEPEGQPLSVTQAVEVLLSISEVFIKLVDHQYLLFPPTGEGEML